MPKDNGNADKPIPFASIFPERERDFAGTIEPEYFQQRLARRKFLKAIERHVPAFLTTVQHDVLPPFVSAVTSLEEPSAARIGWLEINHRSRIPESATPFDALRGAILACATAFNLTLRRSDKAAVVPAAWACEVMALTLSSWHHNPALLTARPRFPLDEDKFPYGDWVERLEARRYAIDVPETGPTPHESYRDFEARILAAIKSQLSRDWEAAQGRSGRATREKAEDQHFVWLALFQVAGYSYSQIASTLRITSEDAIRVALESTAAVLPLTRRPARPGRPPKTRTRAH